MRTINEYRLHGFVYYSQCRDSLDYILGSFRQIELGSWSPLEQLKNTGRGLLSGIWVGVWVNNAMTMESIFINSFFF